MLEKMSKSGAALLLITGTDVVPGLTATDGAMWSGLEMTRNPFAKLCWTIG